MARYLRHFASHFPPTNHQTSAMVPPTTKSCPAALSDRFVSPRPSDSQAVHRLSAPEAGAQDEPSATPVAVVSRYPTLWDVLPASDLPVRSQIAPCESRLSDGYPAGARF